MAFSLVPFFQCLSPEQLVDLDFEDINQLACVLKVLGPEKLADGIKIEELSPVEKRTIEECYSQPVSRQTTPAPDRTTPAPAEVGSDTWLYEIDASAIAHISVTHMDRTVAYENTEGGWVIKGGSDTPVYEEQWAGTPLLLSAARGALVSPNIDDLSAYGLDHPQTTVTLTDYAGARISYILGDPTPDGDSWYAKLAGDNSLYTLPSIWCRFVSELATMLPYPPK